jgi:hypothetical protein
VFTNHVHEAITERWAKRLAARRRLLDDALEDLIDATSAAQQADAKARIALRRDQIAEALTVLARQSGRSATGAETFR